MMILRLPPVIVQGPTNKVLTVGSSWTLGVRVLGSEPMQYQWYHNKLPLPRATENKLLLTNVQLTQSGAYHVIVQNAYGLVTSTTAQIRVVEPLRITSSVLTSNVSLGRENLLKVQVTTGQPLKYQWRLNGVNIPGATNEALSLPNVRVRDGGRYSVLIRGEAGVVLREVAQLRLALEEVVAGDMFAARMPIKGTTGVIRSSNVGATREKGEPWHARKPGGKSVWFTWKAPGTGLVSFSTEGSDFDTLLAVYTGVRIDQLEAEAASEDSGGYLTSKVQLYAEADQVYQIAVDGFAGADGTVVLSWDQETLAVGTPQIITEPEDQLAVVGGQAKFAVVARGRGLTYQWYFNDTRLARATNASLLLTEVSAKHAGNYRVVVAVRDRILSSLSARLEVYHAYAGDPGTQELGRDKLEDVVMPPQRLLPVLGKLEASRQLQPLGSAPSSGFTLVRWGTTGGSSSQSFETGTCGEIGGASQWFRLVLSKPGVCTLSTDGSNFDTLLAVFKETGNLMDPLSDPVACDDNSGADGHTSLLQFAAEKSGSYFVLVDGIDGASGTVKLTTIFEPWIGVGQVDRNAGGDFHFQMEVAKGWVYRIDTTTNLETWMPWLNTNAPQGILDFIDPDWDLYQQKYFRVLPVP